MTSKINVATTMKQVSEDREDFFCTVFSDLKSLGVKVPKIKKFKSAIPKQEKTASASNGKIFGVCLSDQEKVPISNILLPKFIVTSTSYLKKYTRKEIGLFRKAGSISRQRDLRAKLEKGETIEECEPNDIASLLKQWLRELPEPLIPVYMHDLFVRCQSLEAEESKVNAVLLCCHLLPPDHLYTLKHLLNFLSEIASNSDKNKMSARNLAVIMAPNIFVMGSDSIDKSSNNLVQQHAYIVELLIIHSQKVGEIPQCSSLHVAEANSLKYGTDLDISVDLLECSPSKSKKKRRSGPVQDLFSGIRKLVGQNSTPPNSSKRFIQNESRASASRSASKRKADPEVHSMSPAKKQAIAANALTNENLNFTPNSKSSQGIFGGLKEKTGSAHSRRKSFGLLRRKDKKRQKSTTVSAVEEPKVSTNTPSSFDEKLSLSFQDCLEPKICINKSPLLTPSDIDRIFLKSSVVKKSLSDCYLTVQDEEFKNLPVFLTSSQGSLFSTVDRKAPYNLRSGTSTKQALKRKSDVLRYETNILSFQTNLPVKDIENIQETSSSNFIGKSLTLSPLEKAELPRKEALDPKDVNVVADTDINFIENSHDFPIKVAVVNRPLHLNRNSVKRSSSRRRKNLQSSKDSNITPKIVPNVEKPVIINNTVRNEIKDMKSDLQNPNVSGLPNDEKIQRKCSIYRQEAFLIKQKYQRKASLSQVKSADPALCSNSDQNELKSSIEVTLQDKENNETFRTPDTRRLKRKIRNGSIVRGRPNTIKTGLPSDVNCRFNNETIPIGTKRHVLTSTTSVDNDLFINVINHSENNHHDLSITLQIQNMTLSSPPDSSLTQHTDVAGIKMNVQNCTLQTEISVGAKDTLMVPKKKIKERICSNSDSKVHKRRKKSKVVRTNSFPEPIRKSSRNKKLRAVNSSSPRKCESGSNYSEKENVCLLDSTQDIQHNNAKTPDVNAQGTETWVSGEKFLDSELASEEDVFNKRESIAMILKNKPGHVQAKVHLYDHRCNGSETNTPTTFQCSTPGEMLRDSQHSSVRKRMSRRNNSSVKGNKSGVNTCDSSRKCKSRYSPLPPPPKFIIPELNTSSPKLSYPLKELTNISNNGEDVSFNQSPKNSFSSSTKDPLLMDNLKDKTPQSLKLTRNSYSGHTPYKLPKVFRSESSPLLARVTDASTYKSHKSLSRSPSLMTILDSDMSSFSNVNYSNSPVFKTRSSLSIEKLRSDQLVDEWHCEM